MVLLHTGHEDESSNEDNNVSGAISISQIAEELSQKAKRKRVVTKQFQGVQHVLPTSCKVERAFSRLKIIMEDRITSMHPKILENLLFLRENKVLWDQSTVEEAIKREHVLWADVDDHHYLSDDDTDDT